LEQDVAPVADQAGLGRKKGFIGGAPDIAAQHDEAARQADQQNERR